MAYVDTNVIVAKYFPDDEFHGEASSFIELSRKRKVISPVSVVELAAVTSRLEAELQAPKELLEEPPRRRIHVLVEFFIRDCNLTLASVPAQAKIRVAGAILRVPVEYQSSNRLAHALKLKALDLIHLAYADNLRAWGYDLDTFVTCDEDVLKRSENIQQILGFRVKGPSKDV